MTRRDTSIQTIAAVILALCVGASGVLSTGIASEAGKSQLVYSDRATDGDPPAVAYGTAMGAFRGLFVNYLWLRATRLKEEGKFHEAIQLSEAITTLQPRFPRVWAFHAWNMAYNISVSTGNADERWEWVKAGIELLRDEALRYNPNDIIIHKELAWLYIHKVQGFMDDANRFYKREHAKEWTIALGEPPSLPDDTDEAVRVMVEWLSEVVEAPNTLERVIENERRDYIEALPVEQRNDPDLEIPPTKVEELVAEIRREDGMGLDFELLRIVAFYEAIQNSWYAQNVGMYSMRLKNERLQELLDDPEYADAWDRLVPHVRKRVLIDKYKMEPLRMVRYTERYGPLDWRHPATLAIYWASRGVEESLERQSTTEKSYVNTDRIVVHALQELWRYGTIQYDYLSDSEYVAMYNLHFTNAYGDVLENIIRPRATTVDNTDRAFSLYSQGYENFLREVIRLHYRLGNHGLARAWKAKLAGSSWLNTNDPSKWDEIAELSLDQFVQNQLVEERLDIPYVARTEITGSIRDGFLRGLLRGDTDKWAATWNYANFVHTKYKQKQVQTTLADRDTQRMQELPDDIRDVAALVFIRLITGNEVRPPQASRIYKSVPTGIQVRAYDQLARMMSQSGMAQQSFNELFPEPPGIDIYRAQQRLLQEQNRERAVDIERDS